MGGKTGNQKERQAATLAAKTQKRSLKLQKKYIKENGCEHLRKRRAHLQELLELRIAEQATCFHDGPAPNDDKSKKKYDAHDKQINEGPAGIKQMDDLIALC